MVEGTRHNNNRREFHLRKFPYFSPWCILIAFFILFIFLANILFLNHLVEDDHETQNRVNIRSSRKKNILLQMGDDAFAMELVSVHYTDPSSVRILCWVNTYVANHDTRVQAIKETWGTQCDKLLFMSNVENASIPTVKVDAPATHQTLWKKHQEIVKIIYREFGDEFDWFLKCDDDTYVIMDNLKRYLTSPLVANHPKEKPLLLGHRMTLQWWEMFRPFEPYSSYPKYVINGLYDIKARFPNGLLYTPGGGGYVLNRMYLKILHDSLDKPLCLKDVVIPDDWAISFCMYWYANNYIPFDTRDDQKRERFHQYAPGRLYGEIHDDTAYDHNVFDTIYDENNWFSDHNGLGWKNGTQCCAPDSISFHYILPSEMMLMHEYYYGT